MEYYKKNMIYPEAFFRIFESTIESGISWPVNLQMRVDKQDKEIKIGKITEKHFQGREIHLPLINALRSNTASVQMTESLNYAIKDFQKVAI